MSATCPPMETAMTETLYKITGPAGEAIHGGTWTYDLPVRNDDGTWTPGAWTPEIADVALCRRGWHVTTDPTRWLKIGCRAFVVEASGAVAGDGGDGGDKRAAARIRLLREDPDAIPLWWREVERFVASIANVPWFRPQREPDPAWRVSAGRDAARDAAWAAGRDAARDAAWDAARDAAWAAAWDAARDAAWAAAWDAARDAAWDAARDAAWAAAWAAARDTAWDAALLAGILVCDGLPLDPAHVAHARARWAVWEAGYGLAADVGGVLYVYRRPLSTGSEGVRG